MNHCLISNFRLSEGSKFHFRFPISTSGGQIEPWPVNNEGSFDVTLNENCCDFASGMAQAVLIIVRTFFDCLFHAIVNVTNYVSITIGGFGVQVAFNTVRRLRGEDDINANSYH